MPNTGGAACAAGGAAAAAAAAGAGEGAGAAAVGVDAGAAAGAALGAALRRSDTAMQACGERVSTGTLEQRVAALLRRPVGTATVRHDQTANRTPDARRSSSGSSGGGGGRSSVGSSLLRGGRQGSDPVAELLLRLAIRIVHTPVPPQSDSSGRQQPARAALGGARCRDTQAQWLAALVVSARANDSAGQWDDTLWLKVLGARVVEQLLSLQHKQPAPAHPGGEDPMLVAAQTARTSSS
jgi:hypothetical protein